MHSAYPLIYLASSSPRRRELLQQIGVIFEVLAVDVAEVPKHDENPEQYVRRIALTKARAGWQSPQRSKQNPVLGADTEVILAGEILSKPRDRQHGIEMLQRLSGRSHEVISAVALVYEDRELIRIAKTIVYFRKLNEFEIQAYWNTDEPQGKAGGYAIQGYGAVFVERLEGSYSGVVGLPLFETAELLGEMRSED